MYRFYIEQSNVREEQILIDGADVNHIKNVLRMRVGEELILCDGQGTDYHCKIAVLAADQIQASIISKEETQTELPARIYLFQGLPKKDKMELIIQKAVELGVYQVIPVMMKRSVVKLDDKKKEQKKLERWQAIATSAAKQSGRGFIPEVMPVMNYKEAVAMAKEMEYKILPYEHAMGMQETKQKIQEVKGKKSVAIFIGPEGGFEEEEVAVAREAGIAPITLGKRILRTETAGLAILSVLMFALEE
ncbi:16S rRNA (uracil(1498)-N(3))-methyltransferase [Anaerosporobacter faecicola]|uniref:16S rRNA (uracil(1498)-N(3))-methyltransferase n=1 Tax=Anaerosporobacter faecicola TaxID=2718714 RepID=UPI00143BF9E3|nr:16S rRNA (uracil(1498)-N(3))-methyltransferase [Anaerosporobacter faecicola]